MSNNNDVLQGENFSHTVSAQYDSQSSADQAVQRLIHKAQLAPHQIDVVQPHDPHMGHKVEPDDKGIARTLVKSHAVLGLGGLVLGLVLAAVLVLFGPPVTRSSPLMTFIALGFICPIFGLIIAGAVSLRPDHDLLLEKTRTATDEGRWTVIAHYTDTEQQTRVKETIDHSAQTL